MTGKQWSNDGAIMSGWKTDALYEKAAPVFIPPP
jgi:hypothetical protein